MHPANYPVASANNAAGSLAPAARTRRRRSPFITFMLVCAVLVGAFFALCVVLAVVDPPDPAVEARKAVQAKAEARQSAVLLARYAGPWQGQDGTTITVRGDGGADFDMGSVKVQGGRASVTGGGDTLKIRGLLGIGREWAVTKPPHQTAAGDTEMTLGGIVYRHAASGFSVR